MLTIKRPTATTVLYTVSTRSPATTLTAQLLSLLIILSRLITGSIILTLLLWEYRTSIPSATQPKPNKSNILATIETALLSTPPATHLAPLVAQHIPRLWRLALSAGITWLILRKGYIEESLLVIRGLGVQTSTSSPNYLWTSSTRFIPTSAIQDVLIHEAFRGFEVRFYLSIVVEGEEDVVVVFPNILPRREILEDVWRGARACLYEPKT